ncbi:GspH/FimT family protein [Tahibacter amnicola]|uniref:Type II secretion system protein H n=1 Tax=Tahibacter amnicola TaxID=2976241 RepID=A0ABY6B956_9GAMM|nr:GspH/FimT family protein [Tahibacter amnicola]UXI66317.1 GspH/FimT family protein [Tahibacter amnicola]
MLGSDAIDRDIGVIVQTGAASRATGQARAAGFTLVELVIVVLVVTLLTALALPSYVNVTRANRATTQAAEFLTAINLARTEAITRGMRISLCPSADGATCAAGTDWSGGWLVFADRADVGILGSTDTVLRVWPALAGADALSGDIAVVSFTRDGAVTSDTDVQWTLRPQGCQQDQQRRIRLGPYGRSNVSKETCS